MYKITAWGDKNHQAKINVDGKYEYYSDYLKTDSKGTTPLGYLGLALTTCVNMVTCMYFTKNSIDPDVVRVETTISDKKEFRLDIYIDLELSESEKEKIVRFVNSNCPIYNMLSKDLTIEKVVHGK